ncbi:DUF6167 family protein [Actinorugispora endophytica]|uniref:Uncharacterized protein n=1 Tax=Actinorugispora endophytica TaxID=1605990 RepID=A0A4R6UGF7_9ACTN|nr:DUF6167 family protein [Actinorugispora endophytica]TDQ45382.1 hypothetical protein EV190_1324 [Actinorugispora endophytica]
MIGRTLYFVAGAALGGYVVHRLTRTARAWTPGGIAHRVEGHVSSYRDALRELNDDVADAVREHEAELTRRYAPETPEPPASRALPER